MQIVLPHIRFFYSNKDSLIVLKNDELSNSEDNIETYKEILQIDFALGIPLYNLQTQAFTYYEKILNYASKKGFKGMLLSDLINSIFYLSATTRDLQNSFYDELDFLIKENTYNLLKKDDLYFHNISYLLIFKSIKNKEELSKAYEFIRNNKENLGYLYSEFNALESENLEMLYELLTQNVRTSNRMRNLYKDNQNSNKTNGYRDFSALLIIFGKIKVWERLGIKLEYDKVNEIFLNEFGKELSFFYF